MAFFKTSTLKTVNIAANINKFANAMASARYNIMAIVDNMIANTMGLFFDFSLSSFSIPINSEVSTGLITKATNREEDNTIIKVMGRNFMNSPIISSQKASGKNAESVVNVEVMMGQATSPTPSLAARIGDFPSSISL